jgi:putative IMPACT (imprinted ancient) family translation regulator
MLEDIYRTIETPSRETLFKEKASKFFGYAFPVLSEDDVKMKLEYLKKTSFCSSFLLCLPTRN